MIKLELIKIGRVGFSYEGTEATVFIRTVILNNNKWAEKRHGPR